MELSGSLPKSSGTCFRRAPIHDNDIPSVEIDFTDDLTYNITATSIQLSTKYSYSFAPGII